jgi:phosphohistidine phosphatase
MKTLILLRHAEAADLSQGKDIERPLTQRGRGMAVWVGGQLSNKGLWPDFILCSSAQRTKETCQHIQDVFAPDIYPQAMFDPAIYRADAHELVQMIRDQDDMHASLMLIGHNPAIHQLVLLLCGVGEAQKKPELSTSFPPASCVILNIPKTSWIEVGKSNAVLSDYFYPV